LAKRKADAAPKWTKRGAAIAVVLGTLNEKKAKTGATETARPSAQETASRFLCGVE
jgi:hypothetical protein